MDRTFNSDAYLASLADEVIRNFAASRRATTPGLVGAASEAEVRRKLEKLLPSKVEVATGCVIDSYGDTSPQADVVIHEKDNCPVFSLNEAPETTYFPCEGVVATGEVASVLGTRKLKDDVIKIRKVKGLKRFLLDNTRWRNYGSSVTVQGASSQVLDPERNASDQIFGFILCQKFSVSIKGLARKYVELCKASERHLLPNVIASLENGVLLFADADGKLGDDPTSARYVAHVEHPDGAFRYLLSRLIFVCNFGRTSAVFPHSRYILRTSEVRVKPTYFPIDG